MSNFSETDILLSKGIHKLFRTISSTGSPYPEDAGTQCTRQVFLKSWNIVKHWGILMSASDKGLILYLQHYIFFLNNLYFSFDKIYSFIIRLNCMKSLYRPFEAIKRNIRQLENLDIFTCHTHEVATMQSIAWYCIVVTSCL